jgi:hypothetical protein
MPIYQKLEALKEAYFDEHEFELVLDKVLDNALSQYHLRLERYNSELQTFEAQVAIDSETFYQDFQHGRLGDAMMDN